MNCTTKTKRDRCQGQDRIHFYVHFTYRSHFVLIIFFSGNVHAKIYPWKSISVIFARRNLFSRWKKNRRMNKPVMLLKFFFCVTPLISHSTVAKKELLFGNYWGVALNGARNLWPIMTHNELAQCLKVYWSSGWKTKLSKQPSN